MPDGRNREIRKIRCRESWKRFLNAFVRSRSKWLARVERMLECMLRDRWRIFI